MYKLEFQSLKLTSANLSGTAYFLISHWKSPKINYILIFPYIWNSVLKKILNPINFLAKANTCIKSRKKTQETHKKKLILSLSPPMYLKASPISFTPAAWARSVKLPFLLITHISYLEPLGTGVSQYFTSNLQFMTFERIHLKYTPRSSLKKTEKKKYVVCFYSF